MKNTVLTLVVLLLIAAGAYYLYSNNRTEVMTEPTAEDAMMTEESTEGEDAMEEDAMMEGEVTVALVAVDETVADQSGEAVITPTDTGVTVALAVTPLDETTAQPAHLHAGSCAETGDVVYPLDNVVNGVSVTELEVTLAELEAGLPLALNVHMSAEQSTVYTACGDLVL